MANNGGNVPKFGGRLPGGKPPAAPRQTISGPGAIIPNAVNTPKPAKAPRTRTVTRVVQVNGPGNPPRTVKVKAHTRTVTPRPKAAPVPTSTSTPAGSTPKALPPTHDKPPAPTQPTAPQQPATDPYAALLMYQGQSPQALAEAALAPQYAQVAQQQAANQQGLKDFTTAMLTQLGQYPTQVGADYQQAADQINSYGGQAAQMLAALNPGHNNDSLLAAAGAPSAQQTQLAAQDQTNFGGAGANLYAAHGVLPAQTLEAQKAAALTYAQGIPQVQALAAAQALKNLMFQGSQQRAQIGTQLPGLANQYAAAQSDSAAKVAALKQNDAALGIKASTINPSVSKGLGYAANAQGQPITDATGKPIKWATVGVSAAAGKKVNTFLSKQLHIAVTADGTPIRTPDGQVIPITDAGAAGAPKAPSAKDLTNLVKSWHDGTSRNERVPVVDANGKQKINPSTGVPIFVTKTRTGVGTIGYYQAYKRLTAMKVSDADARRYLNATYARGDSGRGWLTNSQQSVLRKAGRQPSVGYYQKHAYLTKAQLAVLTASGDVPPGEHGLVNGKPVYYIAPGF